MARQAGKASSKAPLGCVVAFVLAGGGCGAYLAASGDSSDSSGASTSSGVTGQGATAAAGQGAQSPAAVPQQVTYACTGHAPAGVDITYGSDGSNHSATSLPFTHTDPLDTSVQYYVTTAQLQGGGSVSCTTTVQGSGGAVSASGSADGGYNIASAQVCSTFDGGWDRC